MSDKLTVEMLARRTSMANAEMMELASRAGISFDSPQSEISQEQYIKLQEYLASKPAKSSKTLSLSSGGTRPKLSLGAVTGSATSGPNIVRKRTIAQTRNTEDIDRQVTRYRELEEKTAAARDSLKKDAREQLTPATSTATEKPGDGDAQKHRIKRTLTVRQTRESAPAAGTTESDRKAFIPSHRGPVPQLEVRVPKPAQGKIASAKTHDAATKSTEERGRWGAQRDNQAAQKSASVKPAKPAEKKPRRTKGVATSKGKKNESNVELQLNEFQRSRSGGRSQERGGPLTSTLLTQGFTLPTEKDDGAKTLQLGEQVQVGELAHMMGIKAGELIKELMKLKVMASVNQSIDFDTAGIVVDTFGFSVVRKEEVSLEERVVGDLQQQLPSRPRPPVITVMGHVDHGKTSLLDYIRRSKVVEGEFGGITQHIGAYHVHNDKGGMTFLDTPGHAAFTAMRARGAEVTDIVILVVAADDKVMPQTLEAIQHARSAQVPIVVALNKIDRPEADPERLTNELAAQELVPESWGGDVQFVQVSAHSGEGIDALLEAVMLQAEILELTAPVEGRARGVVVESWLDKSRGPVATVLVKQGTLEQGNYLIAGAALGRVRAMQDERGQKVRHAGPSLPVEILGLSEVPEAGDEVIEVANERAARELIAERQQERRLRSQPVRQKVDDPFATDEAKAKVLPLVVKADTQGSVGAIIHALGELQNDQLELNIVLSGVGGITESDASIAHATGARLLGFNVRAEKKAEAYCTKEGVSIKYYSIIYELIEEIDNVLHGLLDPVIEEKILGIAEVRDVFAVSKFGKIAGCMVTEGSVYRNRPIRVLRDNVVIYEGELESLKRFKEDAREVRSGMECGVGVKNYKDVKAGDKIEVFDRVEKRPTRPSGSKGSSG